MRPSRRPCLCAFLTLFACLALAPRGYAESLSITSSPPGATVEINGAAAGTTPYKITYPGSYFHRPHTVFSSRLDHSMTVKVTLEGYVTEQVTLTQGPFEWVAINGRHHGSYFLLKSASFNIKLDPVYHASAARPEAPSPATLAREGPIHPDPIAAITASENGIAEIGRVSFTSEDSASEIYVDGKFVGQAPATINLSAGSHHVEVKAAGKQPWSRELEVLKDSQLTLHPVLAASP
jgi:PEGA domain